MLKQISLWRSVLPALMAMTLAACLVSPMSATAEDQPPMARTAPLFDFHSNFWVNLHQVLFHEATLRTGKAGRSLQGAAPLTAPGMSKQEAADWDAAVSFYAAHFGTRPQHGDDELITINDTLAQQPDDGSHLDPAGLPPEVAAILQRAAPVYRKYWWPAEDKSNRDWIASQQGRLQDLGPKLAAAMTKDLHQQWPAAPIREDVCYYVVSLGSAFTTTGPAHTTLSSFDPPGQYLSGTNQGLSGFELLFHEASHAYADTIMDALPAEGRAQH